MVEPLACSDLRSNTWSKPNKMVFNSITYTKLIQSSTKTGSSIKGKLAHAHIIKTSFKPCLFLLNNLLNMYCKCGEIDTAHQLFDKMSKPDVISWNSLISGYTQMGFYVNALNLFREARVNCLKVDKFTYASALSVCAQTGDLKLGKVVHGLIIVNGLGSPVYVVNSLIDMYSKCELVDYSRMLFENSDELDDVSWNSLITGYVRNGKNEEMMSLLVKMYQCGFSLNSYVLGSALKACSTNFEGSLGCGKMLHGFILKLGLDFDIVLGTALLDMYSKIGDLSEASQIFELMPMKNVVMYNAMIAAFFRTDNGGRDDFEYSNKALSIFCDMQRKGIKPTMFTFSSLLKACNATEAYEYGKQIHAHICKNNLQSDEFIGCALVELYSMAGFIKDALKCFHLTPKLDIVLWTSMIGCHVHNGQFECSFDLFNEMLASGRKVDQFTLSNMMIACANSAVVRSGEQIQGYAIKKGFETFTIVKNSQICMYANCGDIDSANVTFEETKNADLVSWSAVIRSNAQHGCPREALGLFDSMISSGIVPNHITFLGVLTACSHGGLVQEGLRYYECMMKDYGIAPNVKHCACMVDLLGRAGRLTDAENLILKSGFDDDPIIWRALLSACRVHKDIIRGQRVAEKVIELQPHAAASYLLLYNTFMDLNQEKQATEIRNLMSDRKIKKEPGLSWIEVENKVHSFAVGDRSHVMSDAIYEKLEEMLDKIKKDGFGLVSKDGTAVNHHSEKLAVTFGIISLPKSAPIRVMKNLRVCQDCHTTMKLLSKLENREIVLRDAIRFHRFRDGSCSCQDYW